MPAVLHGRVQNNAPVRDNPETTSASLSGLWPYRVWLSRCLPVFV